MPVKMKEGLDLERQGEGTGRIRHCRLVEPAWLTTMALFTLFIKFWLGCGPTYLSRGWEIQ